MPALINPHPRLLSSSASAGPQPPASPPPLPRASQSALRDELFSLVRRIADPEHPHTLEELGVVSKAHIWFRTRTRRRRQRQRQDAEQRTTDHSRTAQADGSGDEDAAEEQAEENEEADGDGDEDEESVIELTPTVPHCSLATTIGLCVRYKVESSIPHIKLAVRIRDGTHRTAAESQTAHSHTALRRTLPLPMTLPRPLAPRNVSPRARATG